ncbi:MAG: TIGR00282 family metallophosphoesterase [Candidatus Omnitrophica bacterium]|nr:TIGR00282 family metallophosphoesterase [Candidatus Omnitrophota bacterium]
MKVFFIGDIVGSPGRKALEKMLKSYRQEQGIDAVVANGENAAGGSGLTPAIAEELFSSGVDVLTSGDHVWKKREIYDYLERTDRLVRPANYPKNVPGKGSTAVEVRNGQTIGVINIIGRVFMDAVDCPFDRVREEIEKLRQRTPVIIVDMHAEATSEKVAMGWYLAGAVSAVIGTHTHVQTADEKILPGGTAYITDCGMTGPFDSVIGRKKEQIITRFITQLPTRFELASEGIEVHGVIVDIDASTGKARKIERVQYKV